MKLDRLTSFACRRLAALAAIGLATAFACGCSATTSSQLPQTATPSSVSNVAGTTNLMSAELPGPAPKVGKAHLAVDEADSDVDANANSGDESAPKEARRSDGSHRGGSFGMSSK